MSNDQSRILRRAWRFLGRLDLAAILIFVVLALAAVGSCFPQLSSSVAADPERLARWAVGVRTRYGSLTDLLAASGAFRYSSSAVFLVPLALLAAVTLACTLNRWRSVWRRVFHQRVRCSDTALNAAPHAARLTTSPATDLLEIVRESLEQRGFRVRSENARRATHCPSSTPHSNDRRGRERPRHTGSESCAGSAPRALRAIGMPKRRNR